MKKSKQFKSELKHPAGPVILPDIKKICMNY